MSTKQRVVVMFTVEEFAGLLGHLSAGDTPAEYLKHLLAEHKRQLRERRRLIAPEAFT